MKKDQNPKAPALSQKQSKDKKVSAPKPKRLVYISIDLDTGSVLIETSPTVRKIEQCPVGFYVSSMSMSKAKKLKAKFEKRPYLIQNFINP